MEGEVPMNALRFGGLDEESAVEARPTEPVRSDIG